MDEIRDLYFLLEERLDELLAAARTDAERAALRADYEQARDLFWEALNRRFEEEDPEVAGTRRALARARARIEEALEGEARRARALAAVTRAVRLAGRLLALGAAA